MKTRQSLVSNSSSASFVIIWRSLEGEKYTVDEAIKALTQSNEVLNKSENIEELKNHTIQLKDDVFETSFWTSMMNSMSDFGDVAAHLVLEFNQSCRFEIVKSHVEDHG